MDKVQKKVPNLRLKGFTDDWEQRKLGEISDKIKEKNFHRKYTNTLTNSAEFGIINQREFFDKDISNNKNIDGYYVIRPNAFVYNPRVSDYAPFGPINRNKLNTVGIMSPLYYVFSVKQIDKGFLEYYFKTSYWHRFMYANGNTGARSDRFAIKDTDFVKMPIPYPTNKEQAKISYLFHKLDKTIVLHHRKLDLLQQLKKGLLQKMFADKDQKQPGLRFEGFNDDWEQRKFGNISKTRRGLTYKPTDISSTGIRVLRSSNIKKDTFIFSDDDVFVKESAINIPFVENGDILITAANGSTNLIGKHAIIRDIPKNSAVHGGFMLITTSKEYEFLNALMSSNWYKKFIKKYVAGGNGAIGNIRKNDLDNQKIYVPKKDEQEQIGEFFKQLDSLIALHQRKLDRLNSLKKGLLQQMFI